MKHLKGHPTKNQVFNHIRCIKSSVTKASECITEDIFLSILSSIKITFHRLLDIAINTAATEMRATYKAGFKDRVTLMNEVNS